MFLFSINQPSSLFFIVFWSKGEQIEVIMTITTALECNLVLQMHDGDSCDKHDFICLWWFLFSTYKQISICGIKYLYIPMRHCSWTSKTFESKVTFLFYHSCSFGHDVDVHVIIDFLWHSIFSTFFHCSN